MCATQSEVSLTRSISEREICAGDPGPGFEGPVKPRIKVGSALFNTRDLKDWFDLGELVLSAETCAISRLTFVGSEPTRRDTDLAKLCTANASIELKIQWVPDGAGAAFTTTARFSNT